MQRWFRRKAEIATLHSKSDSFALQNNYRTPIISKSVICMLLVILSTANSSIAMSADISLFVI